MIGAIMQSIITLWSDYPASTGAFGVYELLMMHRLPNSPIVVDQSIAGTSVEGFNVMHAFDDLIAAVELGDIKTDL